MSKENIKTGHHLYNSWRNALDLALSGKSKKQRLLYPALAVFFFALAFIFCAKSLPYTSLAIGLPLADALLCAAGAYTPFVYIGNVLGSIYFGAMSIPRMLALSFVFVLRVVTSGQNMAQRADAGIFSEKVVTKLAVSAVMCFITCGMHLAAEGISGEGARAVLATLIATPLLTLVLSVYYAKRSDTRLARAMHEICMLFVFSCTVYCASGITFAFFSVDTLLAVFFILCIAKHGGFARGALYGFALGYILSPTYFISFLLLGAAGSLFFSFGAYSACGIAAAISCICSIFIGGATSLVSIVPETVLACAVVSPIIRYSFLPKGFPYPLDDIGYAESFSENARNVLEELSFISSLDRASDNLRGIEESVNGVSAVFRDSAGTAEGLADEICNGFCGSCPIHPICHETNSSLTRSAIKELITNSAKNGDYTEIPKYLSSHCIKIRELIDYVSNRASDKKESPANELTPVLSYTAVADVISDITARAENELIFDGASEQAVARLMYSAGVPFGGVSVIGNIRKKVCIYGASFSKVKKSLTELQKGLKGIFSYPFATPDAPNDERSPIIFKAAESLKAEVAISLMAKDGEEFNGDTALSFNDGQGNLYALISDGMGSGAMAGRSSAITAELIRGLMLSGVDSALAVRLAGESQKGLCDECFSTVDLLRLDLVSGNASVIKNHAAASYILRNGSVYCCNAQSLPIGISKDAKSEEITFKLGAGDTVIMVSDGVSDGPTDKMKITDMVGLSGEIPAKELADRILAKASEIKGKGDDMSALVIKIKSA